MAVGSSALILANLTPIRVFAASAGFVEKTQQVTAEDLAWMHSNPVISLAITTISNCTHARTQAFALAERTKTMIKARQNKIELAEDDPTFPAIEKKASAVLQGMQKLLQDINITQQATITGVQTNIVQLKSEAQGALVSMLKEMTEMGDDHKRLLADLSDSLDPRPIIQQLQERGIPMPSEPNRWTLIATLALSQSKGVLSDTEVTPENAEKLSQPAQQASESMQQAMIEKMQGTTDQMAETTSELEKSTETLQTLQQKLDGAGGTAALAQGPDDQQASHGGHSASLGG